MTNSDRASILTQKVGLKVNVHPLLCVVPSMSTESL